MDDISSTIQRICIMMPTLLAALVLHEYAHAWVAKKCGDSTADWSGRLTLNPIAHLDLFGSVIFPLFSLLFNTGMLFMWAKPVPINPTQFRNYRKGLFLVSSAGVAMNLVLGFLSAFILIAFLKYAPVNFALYQALKEMLMAFIQVNFWLAVFNLIPIPPLDGSNILLSFLSYNASRKFMELQAYSFYIIMALMFTGALRVITYPIMILTNLAIILAASVLGFAPTL